MLLCSIEEAWGNDFTNYPNNTIKKKKINISNKYKIKIKSNI